MKESDLIELIKKRNIKLNQAKYYQSKINIIRREINAEKKLIKNVNSKKNKDYSLLPGYNETLNQNSKVYYYIQEIFNPFSDSQKKIYNIEDINRLFETKVISKQFQRGLFIINRLAIKKTHKSIAKELNLSNNHNFTNEVKKLFSTIYHPRIYRQYFNQERL